ncbi:MAG: ABC transporter ATP-binding protein [Pseudomonadota bacterium]
MEIAQLGKHKQIYDLKSLGADRKDVVWLSVLTLGFAFFEGFGIAMFLPILEFAETGYYNTVTGKGRILHQVLNFMGFQENSSVLSVLMISSFLAIAIRSVLQYARDIGAAEIKFRVAGQLRKRAIGTFLHSTMSFVTAHDRGELFNVLTLESHRAAEAIASRIVFFNAMVLLFVYLALLFFFSPFLAVYTLPVFALVGFIFRRQGMLANKLSASVYEKNRGFAERIGDYFNCLIRIKMRARESWISSKLGNEAQRIMDDLSMLERLRIIVEIGIYPILVLAAFIILYIAIVRLRISLAELGIFMFVMTRLVPQLTLINSMWAHMHGCVVSFQKMEALIEMARQQQEVSTGSIVFTRLTTGITVDRISYCYPHGFNSEFKLNNLSFFLPRGSVSAIVGRSGAGKTTLVNLLACFYRYQSGDIRLDAVSLPDYSLSTLRRKIAYVSQEPLLFHDTIRSNINFGLETPLSEDRIMELLHQGHCLDIVGALDQGLDSVIGERGCRLSQGQRQRLSIVCGLAVEPEILILDEPTSALDSESENAIQQTLADLKGHLTTIVIAHRFSTISQADQVLVMDQGSLVCSGSHEHLLSVSPLYQALFQTQILP